MPQKHVIVEGMDGSGKDTLIAALLLMKAKFHDDVPHFALHERASTSLGGPVAQLDDWVEKDISEMPSNRPYVYNRHPLISELIYGPVIRGCMPGKFNNSRWLANNQVAAALDCMVVFCDPGFDTIRANLARTPHGHMPGVMENAARLYDRYREFMSNWPGRAIRYNYNTSKPYKLMRSLRPIIQNGLVSNG
jgi:hypothetical protein